MADKFIFGVANCYGYDASDNIMFSSKTLVDSSVAASLSQVDVRGGYGNPLLARYFHSPQLTITLNDTQWNLNFLAKNVGATVTTGKNVFKEETITLGAGGAGTITGTPVAMGGTPIYGWVRLVNGTDEKVEFTGSAFTSTGGAEGDSVTVRYYCLDSAAKTATITSNFIPSIARLVLEAQLFSSEQGTGKVGTVLFEFPKVTLSGGFTVSLTADGVASTPLEASALAYTPSGATQSIFGYVTEWLSTGNWYDDCTSLAITSGNFSLATTTGTKTLEVKAIHADGTVGIAPNSALNFTSATGAVATAGLHTGLITGVTAGTSLITVVITAKNTIEAQCTVTVPS
jgi:hypothetical protein